MESLLWTDENHTEKQVYPPEQNNRLSQERNYNNQEIFNELESALAKREIIRGSLTIDMQYQRDLAGEQLTINGNSAIGDYESERSIELFILDKRDICYFVTFDTAQSDGFWQPPLIRALTYNKVLERKNYFVLKFSDTQEDAVIIAKDRLSRRIGSLRAASALDAERDKKSSWLGIVVIFVILFLYVLLSIGVNNFDSEAYLSEARQKYIQEFLDDMRQKEEKKQNDIRKSAYRALKTGEMQLQKADSYTRNLEIIIKLQAKNKEYKYRAVITTDYLLKENIIHETTKVTDNITKGKKTYNKEAYGQTTRDKITVYQKSQKQWEKSEIPDPTWVSYYGNDFDKYFLYPDYDYSDYPSYQEIRQNIQSQDIWRLIGCLQIEQEGVILEYISRHPKQFTLTIRLDRDKDYISEWSIRDQINVEGFGPFAGKLPVDIVITATYKNYDSLTPFKIPAAALRAK